MKLHSQLTKQRTDMGDKNKYGIDIETRESDDAPIDATTSSEVSAGGASILLFPKFGIVPELEDQLDAVSTDPSAMLESLKQNNITIEKISDEDLEKFGLKDHPLHTEHLEHVA